MWDTWDTRFLFEIHHLLTLKKPEFPWTIWPSPCLKTSRLGWFTSHTGESLLPARPPLKAFIIHQQNDIFCVRVFLVPGSSRVFSTPLKKSKKAKFFFFFGGGGYQSSCVCMLRPTGGKLWKRSAAAVFWDQWWCQNVRPDFLGTVGYASGASILAALLESYRGTVMLKDVGKFCCHAADKIWDLKFQSVLLKRPSGFPWGAKRGWHCRVGHSMNLVFIGMAQIPFFEYHKTMCFAIQIH